MKNLIKYGFIAFVICFLSSCHCIMHEDKLVVITIKEGNEDYKYRYYIEAFPSYQVLYSNEKYNIGDTLNCR